MDLGKRVPYEHFSSVTRNDRDDLDDDVETRL